GAMTNCQSCGTSILDVDRFCKNCGAPAAASVEDLADTHRFEGSVREATPSASDVYVAGTTYPLANSSGPLSLTAAFFRNLMQRKALSLFVLVLLFVFVGGGITIARDAARTRRAARIEQAERNKKAARDKQARQVEAARRALEEAVQNALGFKPAAVSAFEYPDTQGIFVTSLTSDDSPAAVARIEAGDVLAELNGQAIRDDGEMMQVLSTLKPGAEVGVKVIRDDQPVTSKIRVASQSVPPFQPKIEPRDQGFLGTGNVVRRCCVAGTRKWGLEVHRVIDNSPADLAGLQQGDLITEFDNHSVRTPDELARRIHAAKPRTKIKMKVYRGTAEQTVELTIGHGW
ncbi:MAG TPA: PDZ domain-containing protein, partial [Blastocatellia bacterium]|nr:PDZ domain-containing protein [Blastocatellia bacterium]